MSEWIAEVERVHRAGRLFNFMNELAPRSQDAELLAACDRVMAACRADSLPQDQGPERSSVVGFHPGSRIRELIDDQVRLLQASGTASEAATPAPRPAVGARLGVLRKLATGSGRRPDLRTPTAELVGAGGEVALRWEQPGEDPLDLRLLRALASSSCSAAAIRLGRLLLHRSWHNRREGASDPRLVQIPGGTSKLAALVGTDQRRLHVTLDACQRMRLPLRRGVEAGLFTYRRSYGHISFVLGQALHPREEDLDRMDRLVVPVPSHDADPPLPDSRRSVAQHLALQQLVLIEMRVQAEALAGDSAVDLSSAVESMAERLRMRPHEVRGAINLWCERTPKAEPFLVRRPGGYTLAAGWAAELEMLLEGARRSRAGRRRRSRRTHTKASRNRT